MYNRNFMTDCLFYISNNYSDMNIIYQLQNYLNKSQLASKEWLVDYVIEYAINTKPLNILVIAG